MNDKQKAKRQAFLQRMAHADALERNAMCIIMEALTASGNIATRRVLIPTVAVRDTSVNVANLTRQRIRHEIEQRCAEEHEDIVHWWHVESMPLTQEVTR